MSAGPILGVVGATVGGIFGGPLGAQIGFTVGSVVGGIIDPPHVDGPKLGDMSFQTSRDGIPIPHVWGVYMVRGNILQSNPHVDTVNKVSAGKGGPTTTETRRTKTFALGLCRPIGGILRVWENEKLIFDGREETTLPAADNAAFLDNVNIYLGGEDQLPDPELETDTGVGTTPAYRGLSYITFVNKDVTDFVGALPQYKVEVWTDGFESKSSSGTTATQDNWFDAVSSPHPLASNFYDGWTTSTVFKSDIAPDSGNPHLRTFSILTPGGTGLWFTSGQIRLRTVLYSQPSVTANQFIGFKWLTIEAGDQSNWKFDDWYCVTASYSKTLAVYKISWVNLTRGEEVTEDGTIINNEGIDFFSATSGHFQSMMVWGADGFSNVTTPVHPWKGSLGHSYVLGSYIDLDIESNRRLFSSLTGIKSLGTQGELPSGSQALVYLPWGHPSENLGSEDIGTWSTDFFYQDELEINNSVPPLAPDSPATLTPIGVGRIVEEMCALVDVTDLNVSAISSLNVIGFGVAGKYSVADTLRSLQNAFFFDMPEIDGQLVAVPRGGSSVATINRTDMVLGSEAKFETIREQGYEFPTKLHVSFANAETDYTPTKVTSERRSADILSFTEVTVEITANMDADDVSQIADKMHKISDVEFGGGVDFAVSEKFAFLTPADIISVESESGVFKRTRIEKISAVDGALHMQVILDRASTYSSSVTAAPLVIPEPPVTNLAGVTTWHAMDLPALLQSHDTLHLYFAGHGAAVWNGATIEQLVENEWIQRGTLTYPTTIGTLQETTAAHAAGLDTTNTVLVALSDNDIESISLAEFELGGNAALLGDEIINFRTAIEDGDNWRLSYLTRGGLNTSPVEHVATARFVLLNSPKLVTLQKLSIGETITFRVFTSGTLPAFTDEQDIIFAGNSQIEFAPLIATSELIGADWDFNWEHNKRIGAPNEAIISAHFTGFGIQLVKGGTTVTLEYQNDGITYTEAEQIADFGSAITSWDSAIVYGINQFTGNGASSTLSNIEGDKLAFEDGSGYLEFEDASGVLLLE